MFWWRDSTVVLQHDWTISGSGVSREYLNSVHVYRSEQKSLLHSCSVKRQFEALTTDGESIWLIRRCVDDFFSNDCWPVFRRRLWLSVNATDGCGSRPSLAYRWTARRFSDPMHLLAYKTTNWYWQVAVMQTRLRFFKTGFWVSANELLCRIPDHSFKPGLRVSHCYW